MKRTKITYERINDEEAVLLIRRLNECGWSCIANSSNPSSAYTLTADIYRVFGKNARYPVVVEIGKIKSGIVEVNSEESELIDFLDNFTK